MSTTTLPSSVMPVGALLREWRQRRRRSQLDLAIEAEISTRHLSFLETGRSRPSRDMLLRLSEQLTIPLRDRNMLLHAAGFAPVYPERRLDHPALQAARAALEQVLKGHEPFPALLVDRHWNLVSANAAVAPMLAGVKPALLVPPVNVLRVSLHPDGLAPRIANHREWREHILAGLRGQIAATADPVLIALERELAALPVPAGTRRIAAEPTAVAIPFRFIAENGRILSFISTITVFGTPVDITLSELALEAFFPADAETAAILRESA